MPAQPALRSTRAAIFTAVCVTLASAGHALAARTAVAPWAIGVGFSAVYAVAWTLGGTERSLTTIMGGLLGGQFALHTLFIVSGTGFMSGTGFFSTPRDRLLRHAVVRRGPPLTSTVFLPG